MIWRTRQSVLQQIAQYRPHRGIPLKVLIDLTSLPKCGKFSHLGTATADPNTPDPWVRMLNGKRGLHIVVLYLVVGEWLGLEEFPSLAVGLGYPSPSQQEVQVVGNRAQCFEPGCFETFFRQI